MSLFGAMFSGVTALNAQSQSLGMISDNISNINTIGYKTTKAAFSTLITGQNQGTYAPGGVRSSPVSEIDKQGLLQSSFNSTDLAISGDGFFVVTEAAVPTASDARSYTRAGQFSADKQGYLRTPAGFFLQGWRTDLAGVPTAATPSLLTSLESIRVSSVSGSASPTTSVELGVNLPASAANLSTESTSVTVFDSLGVSHNITLTWQKTAANAWTVSAAVPDAANFGEGTLTNGGWSVDIVFNGDGTPSTFDTNPTPPALFVPAGDWNSGANASTVAMNLGTANVANGVTQFSSSYSVAFINQNGVQFGNFNGVQVDENGIVTALFDNGETQKIYKVPIATFPNPNGLASKTGTAFSQSERSGGFFLRAAKEANAGSIVPSSLEASNADVAEEFTKMIITQRAYSAATRIITTADDMMDELIRIKR